MPTITRATINDAETILALQMLAYASEARLYNDWSIPPMTQTLQSLQIEIQSSTVIKAIEGQTLVGSVRGKATGSICNIGRLIVDPRWQGQGIGSSLLLAIEAAFPHVSRFELFTGSSSESNIRLYRRLGYNIFKSEPLSEHISLVFMAKEASSTACYESQSEKRI